MNLKVLDCTLRDGGYINDWEFSQKCIIDSVKSLEEANIDIIEVGFLDDTKSQYFRDYTVFRDMESANKYFNISKIRKETNCVVMIMHGKFNVDSLPEAKSVEIKGIRYCFKKDYISAAIENCKKILEKGYDVYLQPAALSDYNDNEILYLVNESNLIKINAFYIVDTFGVMWQHDVLRYFYLIDNNLRNDVSIGFHSHNNLQLSFSNAQELINQKSKREIIIDTSVFGMGRGAGNLCTELMTKYINENIENKYDIMPILEIMDEYIMPIYSQTPWGYSAPYYLAAVNNCHPNYATFLMNKQSLFIRDINNIIKSISFEKRHIYDEKYINSLYAEYLSHTIDDSSTITELSNICLGRKILIIAPGKSISDYKSIIDEFVKKNEPIVFSINHIPSFFDVDIMFISNLKRFKRLDDVFDKFDGKVICTSNITTDINVSKINYSDYLNDESIILDNAGLILINLLKKIGISEITLAGFDGFDFANINNYYDDKMINNVDIESRKAMNAAIKEYFIKIRKNISVNFITPTIYDSGE